MSIWWDVEERKWHSKLHGKKEELMAKGLKNQQIPIPTSVSPNFKYGIITRQLHHFNVALHMESRFHARGT